MRSPSTLLTTGPPSVLLTGTSQTSIGSALAAAFAARSWLVFATLRDPSKLSPHLAALPNVHVLALDVTSDEAVAAAVAAVTAQTGGTLSCLVNNAGFSYYSPLADVDVRAARAVFDVNFWGVMGVTKAFVPLLRRGRGTVVNVSSVGAIVPTPYLGIYSASKSALAIASETLRLELAPFHITVVTLMLGVVQSAILANSADVDLPPGSMYAPVERQIRAAKAGKNVPKGMDADKFADKLVKDILRGKKGRVWRGNVAHVVKWVSLLLPRGVFDGMISKGMGFEVLEGLEGGRMEAPGGKDEAPARA